MAKDKDRAKIREDLLKKREEYDKTNYNLTKPIRKLPNTSATGKAKILRDTSMRIREDIKKTPLIPDDELSAAAFLQSGSERMRNKRAVRRLSAASDYDKTAARLESQSSRSERSAKYRLAANKAAKKVMKKKGGDDPEAQPGFKPRPFLEYRKPVKKKKQFTERIYRRGAPKGAE